MSSLSPLSGFVTLSVWFIKNNGVDQTKKEPGV